MGFVCPDVHSPFANSHPLSCHCRAYLAVRVSWSSPCRFPSPFLQSKPSLLRLLACPLARPTSTDLTLHHLNTHSVFFSRGWLVSCPFWVPAAPSLAAIFLKHPVPQSLSAPSPDSKAKEALPFFLY